MKTESTQQHKVAFHERENPAAASLESFQPWSSRFVLSRVWLKCLSKPHLRNLHSQTTFQTRRKYIDASRFIGLKDRGNFVWRMLRFLLLFCFEASFKYQDQRQKNAWIANVLPKFPMSFCKACILPKDRNVVKAAILSNNIGFVLQPYKIHFLLLLESVSSGNILATSGEWTQTAFFAKKEGNFDDLSQLMPHHFSILLTKIGNKYEEKIARKALISWLRVKEIAEM